VPLGGGNSHRLSVNVNLGVGGEALGEIGYDLYL
jgi:hypothetical protein